MNINISNASGEPIYLQIVGQVKALILDGTLKEGEMLPSMRNLALELRISFMTTKRAYEELERAGYIENFTGKGCFVKQQNTDFLREETLRQTEEMLAQVCKKARICGLSADELKEMVDLIYSEDNEND
jgi:GntR family transcriptional regulator